MWRLRLGGPLVRAWGAGRTGVARAAAWAAALWIIWISVERGRELQRTAPEVFLGAAPLVGRDPRDGWDWRFGWGILGAAAVAAGVITACWSGRWFKMPMRWVALATAAGSAAFAVLLAAVDGANGLLYAAEHRTEYLANLPLAPPAAEFVRTFIERLDQYSVHVRGHPPGFVLVLKLLASIGIGGSWATALLSVIGTALAALGVVVVVNVAAGADWARRTAPWLIVSPYLVWMVTSADAVFTGVGAAAIAVLAVGMWRRRWAAAALGVTGGLVLTAVMFTTYLAAVLVLIAGAVMMLGLRSRAPGVVSAVAGGLAGAVIVTAGFRAAGFWWFDGVRRTKVEYWEGTAQFRTWGYFGLANVAAALIALGPATFAGLLRLRDRRMWMVAGAAVAALLTSHLSQYTRGEVERIWLLFYPWIAVGGAALFQPKATASCGSELAVSVTSRHRAALWLGLQASSTIALQAALVTKW